MQAQSRLTWLTWLLKPELFLARLAPWNLRLARIYQLMIEQVRCSTDVDCRSLVEVEDVCQPLELTTGNRLFRTQKQKTSILLPMKEELPVKEL